MESLNKSYRKECVCGSIKVIINNKLEQINY
jgi:hypothetical protein